MTVHVERRYASPPITCPNCWSVIRYDPGDLAWADEARQFQVECVACHEVIAVPLDDIPPVKTRALRELT